MTTSVSLASGYGNFAIPPEAAAAAARAFQTSPLPVLPAAGSEALRAALASRPRPADAALLGPANVVITPGAKVALFALLKTVLRPGDEVLLLTPSWFGFDELVARAGGTLRTLALSPDDNYALPAEQLRAALSAGRTRALLFTNPGNPTGRRYSRAELAGWLQVAADFPDLYLLSDEIYDLIYFEPEPPVSLLDFPDPRGRHLVVNGFSKSLGLIGWGLGYLVAPAPVAAACAAWQHATGAAVPAPLQAAALAVTDAAAEVAGRLIEQLRPTRAFLRDFLVALSAAPQPPLPAATYYAFPDLRAYLHPGRSPVSASAELMTRLRTAGVDVVDGAGCHAPGFARLSYAVSEADLATACDRMAAVLR
ncbi:pyridoxal phosphate-dependent aminotransferase [Hymenobacter lapidiphilus]|uniref:Pyridoxal phosphate-dependent aminotransferase n=1 Tax=Hymenobacter lapidiphilus TaxID=2608003 RepID=A0A7Y7PLQ1_9BACT|nr:pyridoxal phosphate-dependent aminotransferase [Hymenobacter lapidiphilus]NVO30123.1 pyridoxal phosphate-dependent aminotransferase [Hymenobacter lapidiphilus]